MKEVGAGRAGTSGVWSAKIRSKALGAEATPLGARQISKRIGREGKVKNQRTSRLSPGFRPRVSPGFRVSVPGFPPGFLDQFLGIEAFAGRKSLKKPLETKELKAAYFTA